MTAAYEPGGWFLTVAEPGAAGTATLVFPSFSLLVDQLEPARVCAVLVPAEDDAAVGPHPGDDTALRLLGRPIAEVLAGSGAVSIAAAARPAVAALVRHDRAMDQPALAPLGALDAVPAYLEMGCTELAAERGVVSLAAALALARAASRTDSAIVDGLGPQRTEALRRAYEALAEPSLGLLAAAPAGQLVEDMIALLTDPSQELETFLALHASPPAAAPPSLMAGRRDAVRLSFDVAGAGAAARLADARAEFLARIAVRGEVPGEVEVTFRLRAGAARRLPALEARIYAWDAELLGAAAVELTVAQDETVRGSATIRTDSVPAAATRASLRQADAYLEIAAVGATPPTPGYLARVAAQRARRAGRDAIRSAEADDVQQSYQHWKAAERLYRAAGLEAAAQDALARASRLVSQPSGAQHSGWLPAVARSWEEVAMSRLQALAGASTEETRRVLGELARDLSIANRGSRALATIYEALAHVSVGDQVVDSAADYLDSALLIYYDAGLVADAERVLRALAALPAGPA